MTLRRQSGIESEGSPSELVRSCFHDGSELDWLVFLLVGSTVLVSSITAHSLLHKSAVIPAPSAVFMPLRNNVSADSAKNKVLNVFQINFPAELDPVEPVAVPEKWVRIQSYIIINCCVFDAQS